MKIATFNINGVKARIQALTDWLAGSGADLVFLDSPEGVAAARAQLRGAPVKLAGNAVGGDSAINLMDLLSPEGTMVTYGAMSRRSLIAEVISLSAR